MIIRSIQIYIDFIMADMQMT